MLEKHECEFHEVIIEPGDFPDDDENLRAGMKVLAPCSCGETPLDHLQLLEMYLKEATDTLVAHDPRMALFHWAPTSRRKQIIRYGLRTGMRPSTSSGDGGKWRANCICFGDSPSWAWAISGEMSWTPEGEWDLWQTTLDLLKDPIVLPGVDRASGIHEIRTEHRVPKRHLWYVGSRQK